MKKKNQKAVQSGEFQNLDKITSMLNDAEMLGTQIVGLVMPYGESREGLIIEGYALMKAWAVVKSVAKRRGVDIDVILETILPSFEEELDQLIDEELNK